MTERKIHFEDAPKFSPLAKAERVFLDGLTLKVRPKGAPTPVVRIPGKKAKQAGDARFASREETPKRANIRGGVTSSNFGKRNFRS